MWCPSCSADVAAELTADERRFLCTRCQTELGLTAATTRPAAVKPAAAEREARELLARWSAHTLLDEPLRPVVPKEPAPSPVVTLPIAPVKSESESSPVIVSPPAEKIRRRVVVRREAASVAKPVELPSIADQNAEVPPSRAGVWLSTVGHLAAYAGIGLITCGTALVIWSHYGGPPSYAPSGWLINALGQMLFFLGLVNLVSGGLEQASADFREQLARLRAQQKRLETERAQSTAARSRRRPRTSHRDAA